MSSVDTTKPKVAVFISGGGSNLQALLDHCADPKAAAAIALVISNKADAYGLVRAEKAGVPTAIIDHRNFSDRKSFEQSIADHLAYHSINLICLAGFLRVLTEQFVTAWQNKMLNIHPSLLPDYKGLHTHERALADKRKEHGCTVHLVRPALDDGPLLLQARVPVLEADTIETLADRVLEQEHKIYPMALDLLAAGKIAIKDDKVSINGRLGPISFPTEQGASDGYEI